MASSERFERKVLETEEHAIRAAMRRYAAGRSREGSWQQRAYTDCEERLAQLASGEITARQIIRDAISAAAEQSIGTNVEMTESDIDNLSLVWRTATIRGIRRAWENYADNILKLDAAGAPLDRSVSTARRLPIPERVRHEVWRRDGGSCVDCGSRERLEFDHIIPVSRGGSNTTRNIELRCEACNRRKGATV